MKKALLISAGTLSLALGVIGIFLPGLPTTPFLLLTSFCYMRSSGKLHEWLHSHKILGPYLNQFSRYRALTLQTKIASVTTLWLVMGSSIFFFIPVWQGRIAIALIGIGVTVYLLRFPTLTKELTILMDASTAETQRNR